jgi:hypothetical protein
VALFSQQTGYKYYEQSYISIPKTDSLYRVGEYLKSIEYNLARIDSLGNFPKKLNYIIAQDYSLLGNEDSAFYYLNKYIDLGPQDYRSVFIDEDFELLKKNKKKWNNIITRIENIYLMELDSSMNKDLAIKLFRIEIEEQKIGFTMVSCRRKNLPTIKEKRKQNLMAQKEVNKIIKKYGFPTPSMVGQTASDIVWDIIQHSLIEDKHYYMVRKAYENGDFRPEHYAFLTDRWLVQNGKKQIYGTQFSKKQNEPFLKLNEVEDFKNLNKRREGMGLSPIEEYAKKINGHIPEEYYNEN